MFKEMPKIKVFCLFYKPTIQLFHRIRLNIILTFFINLGLYLKFKWDSSSTFHHPALDSTMQ
jgi:hypothetical protein